MASVLPTTPRSGLMRNSTMLLLCVAGMIAVPSMVWAQVANYPIIVVPTGQDSYTFAPDYQTPYDEIEVLVTEKMSPNLFVLHGSKGLDRNHPDAAGGRVMVLFGPDGVLMVDTQYRQLAEKTLAA